MKPQRTIPKQMNLPGIEPEKQEILELRLGLPKGSLNDPERANTDELLRRAGYIVKGYQPKKESDKSLSIVNDPEIIAFLTRPQSAPNELERGLLDTAIIGGDWVCEEGAESVKLVKDLGYGKVRLVAAVPDNSRIRSLTDFFLKKSSKEQPIVCYTEYVNTTARYFMQNEGYRQIFGEMAPLIQIRGIRQGDNNLVQIINSDGVTEGYIQKGADIIVDNSQTGSTLREYGLKEIEEISRSSAGLYVGPTALQDENKMKKAEFLAKQLLGASMAINYRLLKFNVQKSNFDGVMEYLKKEKLFLQEPTVIPGKDWNIVEVAIPFEKLPKTKEALKNNYDIKGILVQEIQQMTD